MSTQFAEAFWGAQDLGFDVLMERMKVAKHTCTELQAVFAARADMEEDYVRKLQKLAKGLDDDKKIHEIGGLRTSLLKFKEELEAQAKSRQLLADSIRAQLDKPMAVFMAQQRDRRKEHQTIIEKSLKAKQAQEALVLKSEEKYTARCLELEQLTTQRQQTKQPKEIEKLDAKLLKATTASRQADIDYQQAVEKLHELHSQWVREWVAACEEFQSLEEDRISFIRSSLWTHANLSSAACVGDDEACERLRKTLETCDVKRDIDDFVRASGTGAVIPSPLEYTNYYTGAAAASAKAGHARQPSDKRTRITGDLEPSPPVRNGNASPLPPATPPRSASALAGKTNTLSRSATALNSGSAPASTLSSPPGNTSNAAAPMPPRTNAANTAAPVAPNPFFNAMEDEDGRGMVFSEASASAPPMKQPVSPNPFDDEDPVSGAADAWNMADMAKGMPGAGGGDPPGRQPVRYSANPFDDDT